jgi:hypothetical protein
MHVRAHEPPPNPNPTPPPSFLLISVSPVARARSPLADSSLT